MVEKTVFPIQMTSLGTLQLVHADMCSTLRIQSFEALEGSIITCIAHPHQFNNYMEPPQTCLETDFNIKWFHLLNIFS